MKAIFEALLEHLETVSTWPVMAWPITAGVLAAVCAAAAAAQFGGAPHVARIILLSTATLVALEAVGLGATALLRSSGGDFGSALAVWLFGAASVIAALIATAFAWWGFSVGDK